MTKTLNRLAIVGLLLISGPGNSWAQVGALDMSFNPSDAGFGIGDGPNSGVADIDVLPNGSIALLGWGITQYNGHTTKHVVQLNADGSVNTSFSCSANPTSTAFGNWLQVICCALQPDGKVLVGGEFTHWGGLPRMSLVRFNADGSIDPTFTLGTGIYLTDPNGANAWVNDIELQPDGRIIIAGKFHYVNGTLRNAVARLHTDGSLDNSFANPGVNNEVNALVLQPDGKVLIGGYFSSVAGVSRVRVARLNSDGSLDTGFVPAVISENTLVNALALRADGRIYAAGSFSTVDGYQFRYAVRLQANGALDHSFSAPTSGLPYWVTSVSTLPNGNVLIGGYGTGTPVLVMLNSSGSLVRPILQLPGYTTLFGMVVEPSGGALVTGSFYMGGDMHVARITPDGYPDESFSPSGGLTGKDVSSGITAAQMISTGVDGTIAIGGQFIGANGTAANGTAWLRPDGSIDTLVMTNTQDVIRMKACAILTDNDRLIIHSAAPGIRRINPDGTPVEGFDPGTGIPNAAATCLTIASNNNAAYIGGNFTTYNGVARPGVARILLNGSLDPTFNPGAGTTLPVYDVEATPDGGVFVAGNFVQFNNIPASHLVKLAADGSVDPSFGIGLNINGDVGTIDLLPDGDILITGTFTQVNGQPATVIARLNADGSIDPSFAPSSGPNTRISCVWKAPDGRFVVGGEFTTYDGVQRSRIAGLLPDGTLDESFDPGTGANATVHCIAAQPDGSLLIGGSFTAYDGIGRNRIARIHGYTRTAIRVMLEGPYSGGQMTDALRTLPSFPLTEPFTALGYANAAYAPGATIGASVLNTSGNNAIVDWVIVEMRPVATPGTVAASRAVLLQRDGDVVDLDGLSTVGFAGLAPGNYCVAVRSRNHLPVMSSPAAPISYGASTATVDFTLPSTLVYDNDARKNVNGVMVLAAGDVTFNQTVSYIGAGNDRDAILTRVGGTAPNSSVAGYYREDVNMDGVVKYTGLNNDRDPILLNVGSTTPNSTRGAVLP